MNNSENLKKSNKYQKYDIYFDPIVIADLDCNIIYKNLSAKSYLVKLQIKNNIRRVLSEKNLDKLNDIITNETTSIIDIRIPPPLNRCIAYVDQLSEANEADETSAFKCDKVIVFNFFASVNMSREDSIQSNALLEIISSYNTQKMILSGEVEHRIKNLEQSVAQNQDNGEIKKKMKIITTTYKKLTRLQIHFNAYIKNMKDNNRGEHTYCDVVNFFRGLQDGVTKYLQHNGCTAIFNIKDDIFIVKLREKDFFLINLIVMTFALKYSASSSVNINFFTEKETNNGIVRYEFTINEIFHQIYKGNFNMDYLSDEKNVTNADWLDLKLVSLIADNNNSAIEIKNIIDSKKAAIDIIIKGRDSAISEHEEVKANYQKYDFMSEQAQEIIISEFAILNENEK